MVIRVARGGQVIAAPDTGIGIDRCYLYVPIPAGSEVQYVDSLVQAISLAEIRGADAIVIRLHPSTASTLLQHPDRQQILADIQHRTSGAPVLLLTWQEGALRFFRCSDLTWVYDPEL